MARARKHTTDAGHHEQQAVNKPKGNYLDQTRRRATFARVRATSKTDPTNPRRFNYELNYRELDLRLQPDLYRVGVGEQGVLLVEPYKGEILPYWTFKTPAAAEKSSQTILRLFRNYRRADDFIGMDMARKFLQMGYTRSRRYANHASGRKYGADGKVLAFDNDPEKAESARIFWEVWKKVEADPTYARKKQEWKTRLG